MALKKSDLRTYLEIELWVQQDMSSVIEALDPEADSVFNASSYVVKVMPSRRLVRVYELVTAGCEEDGDYAESIFLRKELTHFFE